MSNSFVHLHNHTEFSMLDGAARVGELFSAASRMNMPALAMTDHGNMFGAYEFWKASANTGVKPIIGLEAYVTPGTHRSDKSKVLWGEGGEDDVSGAGAYTHLTLWAENNEGLHNLFRLSSLASLEGQYYKPRVDLELLERYHTGIIASTGCPSGEVQTRLRLGQNKEALNAAGRLRDIFGVQNFYVELMDHGLAIEKRVTESLLGLSKDTSIPLLATNDLHYTHAGDAKSHAALLCVQSGSTLDDPNRFKFDADEFYLKSPAEMRALFRDYPDACDNTLAIAERCNVTFNTDANYMPRFPVPDGESEQSWFVKEVERGLHEKYKGHINRDVTQRVDMEVDVILRMGFESYFLVVADYVQWAKREGIRVGPGRGSGAGSIVAYLLGITGLDPLKHGLMFERFLNPDRVSMPDFDIDFDERRRGEVIEYVTRKYGDDRVAQIITYGTIKAKQALKDSARVQGYPYGVGDKLSKAMPPAIMGRTSTLTEVTDPDSDRYTEASDLRELISTDPDSSKVFSLALGLENLKRQWGVHAAGVIMSSDPLIDIIPIMRREQDGQIVTQFDYPACESLGLMKMDFLGLRNLTIIDDALDNIEANRGTRPVLEDLPLDDPKVFELLAKADTLGVFQLDSTPMRNLLRMLKPDRFEDISAVIALYRPGPMGADSHRNYALRKNGKQIIGSIHPELSDSLADILDETYGLIIYQEQVMAIAQRVAGYSLGQADILRRAMGKKKKSELDQQYSRFSSGMKSHGYSDEAIKTLWDTLIPFSDYAFNRAHSAAYGMLSYWTAYLKAHYPAEYMAALLTSVGDARDKLAVYLNECRRMGIKVLNPDINESSKYFTAVGGNIRFGLQAIKGVGDAAISDIVDNRDPGYTSFDDALTRTSMKNLTLRSLIKAGAFDSFGHARKQLFDYSESSLRSAKRRQKSRESATLFDFDDEITSIGDEWDREYKLAAELDVLGFYVSEHPLSGLETVLYKNSSATIVDLVNEPGDYDSVDLCVLVTQVDTRVAKRSGNHYAIITVQDLTGQLEVPIFGRAYTRYVDQLHEGRIYRISCRVSVEDDSLKVYCDSITPVGDTELEGVSDSVVIEIPRHLATANVLHQVLLAIQAHPGNVKTFLKCEGFDSNQIFSIPIPVEPNLDFYRELDAILQKG